MHVLCQFMFLVVNCCRAPSALCDIFIRQLIKYAVASKHNEIVVLSYLETEDVRLTNNYVGVTAAEFVFCLWVTEGT